MKKHEGTGLGALYLQEAGGDTERRDQGGERVGRRVLRNNPTLVDVPIIAVTSYAMFGDRDHILAAGCTDYIEKPIDPETFVEYIQKYL